MKDNETQAGSTALTYTFERVVAITGVDRGTIIEYCRTGLLPVGADQVETTEFDDQFINLVRRVETLRSVHGINDTGIQMILDLMDELERLRRELKFRLDQ